MFWVFITDKCVWSHRLIHREAYIVEREVFVSRYLDDKTAHLR